MMMLLQLYTALYSVQCTTVTVDVSLHVIMALMLSAASHPDVSSTPAAWHIS